MLANIFLTGVGLYDPIQATSPPTITESRDLSTYSLLPWYDSLMGLP